MLKPWTIVRIKGDKDPFHIGTIVEDDVVEGDVKDRRLDQARVSFLEGTRVLDLTSLELA